MRRSTAASLLALLATALLATPASAQSVRLDTTLLAGFAWRPIGPANMAGRISGIAANPLNPKVIYVATATGGLWKTVNAGTTWTPIFENQPVHSISEVAVAPSDTSVIWIGTGEEDSRNSISPGGGVFKSTDAGRTWTFMGLKDTRAIGRVLIHPTDPNTVYIAALGHAWGPNAERGLYKTTDGGRTWQKVNFVSDRAGFIDVAMDPTDPNVLLAASWERVRGPYFLRSGGPGSALWRSEDGGTTWRRVTGGGFPATTLGRIAVAFAPSNHLVVYAHVEADSIPNAESLRRGFVADTTKRQKLQSGLYRSADGGTTWAKMNDDNDRPFYYSQVRVDPRNPDRVYWFGANLSFSNDGGRTMRRIGQGVHSDFHAMWIDPADPDHYIVGEDGGVDITYDRGRSYDHVMQMALGQFYAVSVDLQKPFWVCGGLQDNGSWCGPSQTLRPTGIQNQDWINVGGGDGFYTAMDPADPNIVYSESQGGAIQRTDLSTGERTSIRPGGRPLSQFLEDSLIVTRGDTTVPATPDQQRRIDAYRARVREDSLARPRFNWSSPFFVSPHNPTTLYMGGNRLFKSVDRGDHWVPVSEDLSTRDTMRIRVSTKTTGGVTLDATGAETYGTITTAAESPLRPGILWAGTDDGNVWVSRNDGATWENLAGRFPGVPPKTWVTRVEPSHFDSATAYVTFDGHRDDNFRPYVFVTSDFGRTFRSLSAGLPDDFYVHVIREDPRRRELLFLGTEYGPFVSLDAGQTWARFNRGMPTAPVHDIVIHPRDRVAVAGTHGRSIFTVDVGPLEELTDSAQSATVALFSVDPAVLYSPRMNQASVGSKLFTAPNPPYGARIAYRLAGTPAADTLAARRPAAADTAAQEPQQEGPQAGFAARMGFGAQRAPGRADTVTLVVTGPAGDTVRAMKVSGTPGLHWVSWDLRRNRAPLGPAARRDSIRAADRQRVARDSAMAAARADTTGGRRGRMPFRDPEPGEPGTPVLPSGSGFGGGGRGFGGFGGAGFVVPGDYLLTLKVGSTELHKVIHVERMGSYPHSVLVGGVH